MRRNVVKKPFICGAKNETRQAGFFDPVTGQFEKCCDINTEMDIDHFLSKYDLSVVCISNARVPQVATIGV